MELRDGKQSRPGADPPVSQADTASPAGPGKRTLTEALGTQADEGPARSGQRRAGDESGGSAQDGDAVHSAAADGVGAPAAALPPGNTIQQLFGRRDLSQVQRTGAPADRDAVITPPIAGIDRTGFVDHSDGAFLRTGPREAGGTPVRPEPLPPATRVFATGTHPQAPAWTYVTAFPGHEIVRGYVQGFRVNFDLPEPLAELRQLRGGETAEGLAREKFGQAVRDGHDLRFYENVLLYVNKGRAGISGAYQDPGVLGGGANNLQLSAGHRIWLVSAEFARSLETVVPSGSLTGGALAKARRFAGHVQDILHSVTDSRRYLGEVAGEYAQAIRDHQSEILGIVAAFLAAEALSALLAAVPTGVTQIIAVVIQLILSALGAAGMIEASVAAAQHGAAWLTTAWTAHGQPDKLADASREFIKMLVSIAMAALSYLGARGNYGNALKIASSMPTGGLPALAVAGGGQIGGAGAHTSVLIGPGTGSLGVGGAMMSQADKDGHDGSAAEEAVPKLPESLDKRLAKIVKDVIQRARAGKLLKAGNYHPHFDDSTVLSILKDAEAIYQSEGKASRLIFRKGNDIVVVEGPGSGQGNVVTGYGPSGIKGDSGAAALGGAAGEGGAPITHEMIVRGTIPVPRGRPPIPKAVQIAP